MNIEEKAKAYDNAIRVAKDIRNGEATYIPDGTPVIEAVFPELAESEDERMMKAIKLMYSFIPNEPTYIGGVPVKEIFAWLEKQGEQNLANSAKTCKDEQKPILDVEIPFGAKDSELQEASYSIPNGYHAEIEDNNVIIKKGEHKPWSEEDEDILNTIINHFKVDIGCTDEDDMVRWLKSLKDRVQPQPKHGWSEEDKKIIDRIESEFLALHRGDYKNIDFNNVDNLSVLNWVRKIKFLCFQSRWKPSDEQMNTLEYYMHTLVCNEHKEILFGLYADLKKLMEE